MPHDRLDISDSFTWDEDLPRPQWDLLTTWVENRVEPPDRHAAWSDIARQWLERLRGELGDGYRTDESDNFLLLTPKDRTLPLLPVAERCRQHLLEVLPGVANFRSPGNYAILALKDHDDYYKYISAYYPEGTHGGSAGVHVREGYPHIGLDMTVEEASDGVLAHELTHAAVAYLELPRWVDEGLAQVFGRFAAGQSALLVDRETADKMKRGWGKRGLTDFWRGESFLAAGNAQKYSYLLAEILVQLLIEDHRPRWFGLVKGSQKRFFAFLRHADAVDCGESAAQDHLGVGLSDLAARFLGTGDWSPSL